MICGLASVKRSDGQARQGNRRRTIARVIRRPDRDSEGKNGPASRLLVDRPIAELNANLLGSGAAQTRGVNRAADGSLNERKRGANISVLGQQIERPPLTLPTPATA
jgi:hypothetical protein